MSGSCGNGTELGYDQSVLDLVFHANAERVLGL